MPPNNWLKVALAITAFEGLPVGGAYAIDEKPAVDESAVRLEAPEELRNRARRYPGRLLLEGLAVQLGGAAWYWQDLEFNRPDWDLKWDWPSWKRKLTSTEAIRYDQNHFKTNAFWHPLWGALDYQIARGNGFGAGTAYLFSFGSGLVWEYVVESSEYPSRNDLIVNPNAGFALGEPLFQLGEYFARGSPTTFNEVMSGALSPVASVNRWSNGGAQQEGPADVLGFSRSGWHRFQLSTSFGNRTFVDTTRSENAVSLETELITLRGYDREGTHSTWVKPGAWTSMKGNVGVSDGDIVSTTLITKALAMGHHWQTMSFEGPHRAGGWGLLLGLGSGFEYGNYQRPDGSDFLANMNLIGPVWELAAHTGKLHLRWSGGAYGDFALVSALALDGLAPPMTSAVYHPSDSGGVMPGVVGARGYYYGWGVTADTRFELEFWGWDLGAETRLNQFHSLSGADRFEEEITDPLSFFDRRLTSRVWLGLRPWGRWGRLTGGLQWRRLAGRVDAQALHREEFDRLAYLQLSLVF